MATLLPKLHGTTRQHLAHKEIVMRESIKSKILHAQEVAAQNGYDFDAIYKKCGKKIQELFDISSSEFQAARYRGKHERFGDILVWIFDERSKRAEQAQPILSPNKNGVGTKEIEIAAPDQEILLPPRRTEWVLSSTFRSDCGLILMAEHTPS